MPLNLGTIIAIVLISVVIGLIGAGLLFLYKTIIGRIKVQEQWRKNKGVMELKNISEVSMPKEIKVNSPEKQGVFNKLFNKQVKKEDTKEDYKLFNEANNEMNRLKREYEKGNLSYNDLKDKFNYYKSQEYYKRVLERRANG
jgi:hypothetical protein